MAGLFFAPAWEFLAYYERLPLVFAQISAAIALAIGWIGTPICGALRRFGIRKPLLLLLPAVLVPANFLSFDTNVLIAAVWHAVVGGAALAALAGIAAVHLEGRTQPEPSLRWLVLGIALVSWLHPPLALAIGGSTGWWMAATVFVIPAVAGLWTARVTENVQPFGDDPLASRPSAIVLGAGFGFLVFALPAYFDLAMGSPTAAPLGTLSFCTGLLLCSMLPRTLTDQRAGWLGIATAALLVVPFLQTWPAAGLLFLSGIGAGSMICRLVRSVQTTAWTLLGASMGSAGAGLASLVILSGSSAGPFSQWSIAALVALVPAAATLFVQCPSAAGQADLTAPAQPG
ncbi:hypothetical protein [Novosphingobium aquae]|uniref:MFS transporter n=1 Tax=Novosphingobium aquae TaxID=3133435 RepID=A0ABU8SC36_9SPHN